MVTGSKETSSLRRLKTIQEALEHHKSGATLPLWTIQPWEVWEAFQQEGRLRADGRRVDPYLRPAYRWMMQQMAQQLPHYSGRYLLWAWYYPKPDVRWSNYLPRHARGVRIACSVPASRVLLSDFDAWHCVLNKNYFGLTEEEDHAWERRLPNQYMRYEELPSQLQKKVEASWERIFDFRALHASAWTGPVRYLQAVLEEIHLHEVVDVTPFIAR